MNDKEYTYDIDKYTIGVDENGEDGIGLTVAIIKNGEINFLGNCYGENARCLDLLIKENQKLKKQLEQYQEEVCILDMRTDENIKYKNQQKEFINYLEDEIKRINPNNLEIGELNLRLDDIKFTQYLIYKENLQKYKSIIGDDKQ